MMSRFTGAKWGHSGLGTSGGVVTWSFASFGVLVDDLAPMDDPSFRRTLRAGFDTWQREADIVFREVADSYTTDIRIGWTSVDGAYGTLAYAKWQQTEARIVRAEIAFDIAETWTSPATTGFDFAWVALHEIGHAVGLGHFEAPDSIMFPYAGSGGKLSVGDKQAIRELYGPPSASTKDLPPGFDALEYIASYADLARAFGTNTDAATSHYLLRGRLEGREVSFDGLEYVASYVDLSRAFGADAAAGARHFIDRGRLEGREVDFDGLEYIASYVDLGRAFGADSDAGARHFIQRGRAAEGREISFDGLEYIASWDDLIRAFGSDHEAGAQHYIHRGRSEGRNPDRFDAEQYLENYEDLGRTFGNDREAAADHYIRFGFWEGRTDDVITAEADWFVF